MSDHFKRKKENAQRVNKLISDLESKSTLNESLSRAQKRYDHLKDQYNNLEQVFQFHKGIIQNISSGILTIDMNGAITFMNRSALQLTGFKNKDIQGRSILELFADHQEGKLILDQLLNEKRMFESRETRLLNNAQKILPVGFSTTILENVSEDGYSGIVFIFRDITETINFKRQIERMERQSTLGELAAGIAHEIRNPLAGIKTSAQVLEESFSPGDFRSQLVSRIVREIDRSNDLLKRFFNFAKPNKPKQEFHHVRHFVDGVYLLMATRMRKKKISYDARFDDEIPNVFVDESQIEQVVLNLFLNALEAMPNGGKLSLEAGIDKNTRFENKKYQTGAVSIRISDNGIGIPFEDQEKIFNPFYTTKSDGMGLGLSISSRLLEENDAKLEVSSKPDKGSVFTIYLPILEKVK